MNKLFLRIALLLVIPLVTHPVELSAQAGYAPVPQNITVEYQDADSRVINWGAVAGHGPQTGLITASQWSDSTYYHIYGTDQVDWDFGDGQESRGYFNGFNVIYYSSYGFDIIAMGNGSNQGVDKEVFRYQDFAHTPFPLDPFNSDDEAKFDQLHHFNADSVPAMRDMVDLSPVGITHPDQLIWYPSENGYLYNYLLIEDNNGDSSDVAGGINIREDRLWNNFSLTDNIIYADGQTTYNVYRRAVGETTFTQIATGVTDSTYTDTDLLQPQVSYEYVVTSNDMFGESAYSDSIAVARNIGTAEIPDSLAGFISGLDDRELNWAPVRGHGSQEGLITNLSFSYAGLITESGIDQTDWTIGSSIETRRETEDEASLYPTTYGVDLIWLNASSGPDDEVDVISFSQSEHTPFPMYPGASSYARYDQVYYFNADSSLGELDMIDLSSMGVTHPDQVEWLDQGSYAYLILRSNESDPTYVAGALAFRTSRFWGTFSLTENVIYASGQTTYNVYRRLAGTTDYTLIVSGITDTTYTDTEDLPDSGIYEYAISATDYLGESALTTPIQIGYTPFPVEWLGFEAEVTGPQTVQLDWSTASEVNSAYFEVERSLDGRDYASVGQVSAAGNSQEIKLYQFEDRQVPEKTVFYRLRQVDLDGAENFSEVRSVNLRSESLNAVYPYPNPAQEKVWVKGLSERVSYKMSLLTARGVAVFKQQLTADFEGVVEIDMATLPAGIYVLVLENEETGRRHAGRLQVN